MQRRDRLNQIVSAVIERGQVDVPSHPGRRPPRSGCRRTRAAIWCWDLWGRQSVVAGDASVFRISSAGMIKATVPAEGVALYRVIPLR
jgi:hypothetical protein